MASSREVRRRARRGTFQGGKVQQRYHGGWTPRARNGGDNTDAQVNNKISGVARILGVHPDADISSIDPARIAAALAYGEGPMRRNNPTNLRIPGQTGFQSFGSQGAGLNAASRQVGINLRRGQRTIRSMIEGLPVGGY